MTVVPPLSASSQTKESTEKQGLITTKSPVFQCITFDQFNTGLLI